MERKKTNNNDVKNEHWHGLKARLAALVKNRSFYVGLFIIALMVVLTVKLYSLQVVRGDEYKEKAHTSTGTIVGVSIDAPRGKIYDRNGILIATNRKAYKITMVNKKNPQSERDAMYLELVNLFDRNSDTYVNELSRYLASSTQWSSRLEGNTERQDDFINKIVKRKSHRAKIKSAADAFEYLRTERFAIDPMYSDDDAYKIMIIRFQTFSFGLSNLVPTVIGTDCCEETVCEIETRYYDFPGVSSEITYFREYVNGEYSSHIIGYVRAINREEYAAMKDQGYTINDVIGKIGIEKTYESQLKGTDGLREIYLDTSGEIREYSYTPPIPGSDVYLTIDYDLQEKCVNHLKNTIQSIAAAADGIKNFGDAEAGSVVVMNVKTAEILSMANYPNYDNRIFLEPSSNQEAQEAITNLFKDPTSPSLNRATQGLYPIGSTFKPVVAVASLMENVITTKTKIQCSGFITIFDQKHHCLSHHGNLALTEAIARSCNVYFMECGIDIGIDTLDYWAKSFGLGEKTGVEISEYMGYRNNEETMKLKEQDSFHVWSDSDTAQASIGQLYNLFTPLQLCRYTCALANGGYLNQPHLVSGVKTFNGNVLADDSDKQSALSKIEVTDVVLSDVQNGMVEMIKLSSKARLAFADFPEGFVAAKTGTPETGMEAFGQSSHSVLICYAPANDPEIAVSIVIEHGASGSNSLALAAAIMKDYFGI